MTFSKENELFRTFNGMEPGDRVVLFEAIRIAHENRDYSPVERFSEDGHDHLTLVFEVLENMVDDDRDSTREVWL